jgi:hypothetical protein
MAVKFPQMQKHLENIERELAALKRLLETTSRDKGPVEAEVRGKDIESLKRELRQEGFDEDLLQLVGTVPLRQKEYKEEIRAAISARQ